MARTRTAPFVLPSGLQVELVEGAQRATVVEVGGGLRAYRLGDWEVLDGYEADEMCSGGRGQQLMPWPNRLRDGRYEFGGVGHQLPLSEPEQHNAIHGLVRWASWNVAEHEEARVVMEHVLHPRPGYPFTLHLAVEYSLAADPPGLTVRTTATNVGAEPCPFGAGAHPYLTLGGERIDDAVLSAAGASWLRSDDRQIPVGREPVQGTVYDFRRPRPIGGQQLDTAYADLERGEDGTARVVLGCERRTVTLWMDASYPYLMLFTGDTLPEPERRRRGLGVEPMTCAPNAFQSGEGIRILQPGEQFTATWGIQPAVG
jgi:aldose 1-epimerase